MRMGMSMGRCAALVLFVVGAAACATGRKDLGSINVAADPPRTPAQVIADYTFHVSEGELALESPGNPTTFDLTEEPGGCLRGNVEKAGNLQEICRLPASNGDAPGVTRWKSSTGVMVFAVQLNADGSRIIIDAKASHGEFLLGQGPVADELRKRPELLGAAFAYGYLPPAYPTDNGPMLDYRYIVSSMN